MPIGFQRLGRGAVVAGAVLASVAWFSSPASASPETLKRSIGNIMFSPVDFVLSPVVATHTIYNNLRDVDDSVGVRVVYLIPGIAWNTTIQAMAAGVRMITGLIEVVPGIGLFFFRADLDPIYAPIERGNALIDTDTPVVRVKFGVDYMTVPY
jgi:hypothetical protein